MTVMYIDGGCAGNGQKDMSKRRMVALVTDSEGQVLSEETKDGGSNNIAELWAIVCALRWAQGHQHSDVEIRTDSRNNLSWANGSKLGKRINDRAAVVALQDEIAACRRTMQIRLVWVPRDANKAGHVIEGKYGL